jgi:hypothetical protein
MQSDADPSDEESPDELGARLERFFQGIPPIAGQAGGNVVGALIGLAFLGPGGALVGAAAAPILAPGIQAFVRRALTFNAERTTRALDGAAHEAGISVGELLEWAGTNERRALFTAEVIAAAQATLLDAHIRVLSKVLADGIRDDAVVDTDMLLVRTLADIEKPHLQVLQQVAQDRTGEPVDLKGWQAGDLVGVLPHVALVLDPVLAVLSRHGLIDDETRGTYDRPHEQRWVLTGYGRRCLKLLEEAGGESSGQPGG